MPKFPLPIQGYATGLPYDKPIPMTSGYMDNVRVRGIFGKQLRLGQREGLDKAFSQQIGGTSKPIVVLTSITVVD